MQRVLITGPACGMLSRAGTLLLLLLVLMLCSIGLACRWGPATLGMRHLLRRLPLAVGLGMQEPCRSCCCLCLCLLPCLAMPGESLLGCVAVCCLGSRR